MQPVAPGRRGERTHVIRHVDHAPIGRSDLDLERSARQDVSGWILLWLALARCRPRARVRLPSTTSASRHGGLHASDIGSPVAGVGSSASGVVAPAPPAWWRPPPGVVAPASGIPVRTRRRRRPRAPGADGGGGGANPAGSPATATCGCRLTIAMMPATMATPLPRCTSQMPMPERDRRSSHGSRREDRCWRTLRPHCRSRRSSGWSRRTGRDRRRPRRPTSITIPTTLAAARHRQEHRRDDDHDARPPASTSRHRSSNR